MAIRSRAESLQLSRCLSWHVHVLIVDGEICAIAGIQKILTAEAEEQRVAARIIELGIELPGIQIAGSESGRGWIGGRRERRIAHRGADTEVIHRELIDAAARAARHVPETTLRLREQRPAYCGQVGLGDLVSSHLARQATLPAAPDGVAVRFRCQARAITLHTRRRTDLDDGH